MLDIRLTLNVILFSTSNFVKSLIYPIAKEVELSIRRLIFSKIVIVLEKYYYFYSSCNTKKSYAIVAEKASQNGKIKVNYIQQG